MFIQTYIYFITLIVFCDVLTSTTGHYEEAARCFFIRIWGLNLLLKPFKNRNYTKFQNYQIGICILMQIKIQ